MSRSVDRKAGKRVWHTSMTDRDDLIRAFLTASRWCDWHQTPIAGDASARRYFRLTDTAGQSVIVMDAPLGSGQSTTHFAQMCTHLQAQGLCPPQVFAHDPDVGLMVIADLGSDDFAAWLRLHPSDQKTLYSAAIDVLAHLDKSAIPVGLTHLTPEVAADMVDIVGSHYARHPLPDLHSAISKAFTAHVGPPNTLALRDFHAENLIWRPQHASTDRVGLLDFQDAFVAPAGYDLASLLRDVRRDVPAELAEEMITYFCSKTNVGPNFRVQLACLGVQRNLRILGVFARLATEHGKTGYLKFMPRVWAYILADLAHPALARLRDVVHDTVPAPADTHLAVIAQ